MISRDHQRPDAGRFRAPNGLPRLRTRRVDHADQPEEHELMLELLVHSVVGERILRPQTHGYAERAQRLLGEALIGSLNRNAPLRGQWPPLLPNLLMRAAL